LTGAWRTNGANWCSRLFTTVAVIVESQREIRFMSVHATIKEQVKSGLRRTAGWLAGMAWLGLVFWGIVEAFGTEANFSERHHPSRVLGYFILVAAAVIFVITADLLPGN
jgi:CHASE2 domain-containing sensor protein